MKREVRVLYNKVEKIYDQYATMEGCDKEELDSLYNELHERAKAMDDYDILAALHTVLIVKCHQISGVIIENGVKIKYTNHDSVATAEILEGNKHD